MESKIFKFSVIIPVYNAADYLAETMDSLINQTIGFWQNIQVILVNDGSTDNSEQVCKQYEESYPENVVYVSQENAGVSAARNHGLKYAKGTYVNFLDSDDKWTNNSFKDVDKFFEKAKDEIDFVACRLKYFEAKENYHVLDYKFTKDRIVDVLEQYDYTHMNIASGFVKLSALEGREFDTTLKYGEDSKLANIIILDKKKYGIVSTAVYLYRARFASNSAMNQTIYRKTWYTDTIEGLHKYLLKYAYGKDNKIIPYLQYTLMYDLKWRIKARIPEGVLTKEEEEVYLESLREILQSIDDQMILEQKGLGADAKVATLVLKYGDRQRVLDRIHLKDDGAFYYDDLLLTNYRRTRTTVIHFIDISNNEIRLEGKCHYWMDESEREIYFINENQKEQEKYYPEFFPVHDDIRYGLCGILSQVKGFRVTIPYKKSVRIGMMFGFCGKDFTQITLGYGKFSRLNMLKNSYAVINKKYLVRRRGKGFQIMERTPQKYKEFEKAYCKELKELGHREVLKFRYIKRYMERKKKNEGKQIWLISDRINIARDNGEAFFTYLCQHREKVPNVDFYFVMDKNAEDFKRMEAIGKVVDINSFKYKCLFLAADWIISAHADEYVINAFDKNRAYLGNMYDFKYAFLQHGITKDDISSWLNRFNKDISLFVTAAKKEYQSILDGMYYYDDTEVKHTGFPRHDRLRQTNERKKQLIFLPTWRAGLVGPVNKETGEREYNPEFKNSDFCQFYNRLMQDERIIEVMKKNGYVGKFCLHTNNMKQIIDFKGNSQIHINEDTLDYTKEFLENALMITDYSSVAFDFAYTKKPVIYVQVDREAFFAGQVYDPGYFSYEQDGFGPVCYDYEQTVAAIIKAIENDCRMEEKYLNRVENFFGDLGESNCENVLNEILKS